MIARKLVVELIGTFFLVLTVGAASANNDSPLAPLAIGGVLMVMIFAGGHISGGHFNPAVSTAVLLRGEMDVKEYPPYLVAQIVGALLAGAAVLALGLGAATPADGVDGAAQALLAEFLFTFALAWVVLHVATAPGTEGNSFYGLAIGFTVVAGAVAVGPVSGGAFNPAVAVGAMVPGVLSWGDLWIYLLANFAGGAAAAFAFLFVNPAEKRGGDVRAADPDDARQWGDAGTMGAADPHSQRG